MRRAAVAACAVAVTAALTFAPAPAAEARPRTRAGSAAADGDGRAERLADIAAAYGRKQRWDEAVDLLLEAHAARPADGDIFSDLVVACFHSARCAPRRQALFHEARASLANPGDLVDELSDLAEAWIKDKRYEPAVALLDSLRAEADSNELLEDLVDACGKAPSCAPRRLPLLRQAMARLPKPDELVDDYVEELFRVLPARQALPELAALVARHRDDDVLARALLDAAADHDAVDVELAELPHWLARHPDDVERRIAWVEALHDRHRDEYGRELDRLLRVAPSNVTAQILRAEEQLDHEQLAATHKAIERLRPLAKSDDERQRLAELEAELRKAVDDNRRDFRRENGWLDLADDLEREHDREP